MISNKDKGRRLTLPVDRTMDLDFFEKHHGLVPELVQSYVVHIKIRHVTGTKV